MDMNEVHDKCFDVTKDWAAYKRQKRQEREQRTAVLIVGIGLIAGFALLVCSVVVHARREARENAYMIRNTGGAQ